LKIKIPKISENKIRKEFEQIVEGKDKTQRGKTLYQMSILLIGTGKTKEQVIDYFVKEYNKKYGLAQKKGLGTVMRESVKQLKSVSNKK